MSDEFGRVLKMLLRHMHQYFKQTESKSGKTRCAVENKHHTQEKHHRWAIRKTEVTKHEPAKTNRIYCA